MYYYTLSDRYFDYTIKIDPKTLSKKTVEPGWFNRFAGSLREIEENEERETVGWYAANR